MQFTADPELKKQALLELRLEYGIGLQRPGIHQSELSHCLTKSYWDKRQPAEISDKTAVTFAIGFMFEKVLLSREETPPPFEVDGITLSLDTVSLFGPTDTKTTRMRAAGTKANGRFVPPDYWAKQFMAYRYALNRVCGYCNSTSLTQDCPHPSYQGVHQTQVGYDFGVIVLHLVDADITAWRYTFTQEELEANWNWLLQRRRQLEWMLAHEDPQPFQHNYKGDTDTECDWYGGCHYKLSCGLHASLSGLQKPSNLIQFPV